jgi:hypothetical protein
MNFVLQILLMFGKEGNDRGSRYEGNFYLRLRINFVISLRFDARYSTSSIHKEWNNAIYSAWKMHVLEFGEVEGSFVGCWRVLKALKFVRSDSGELWSLLLSWAEGGSHWSFWLRESLKLVVHLMLVRWNMKRTTAAVEDSHWFFNHCPNESKTEMNKPDLVWLRWPLFRKGLIVASVY